jgi:hypothetical protein
MTTNSLVNKPIKKRAKCLGFTANLANVHLHTTYLETEELEGHFRRFLNDPELLKRLQWPKCVKSDKKKSSKYTTAYITQECAGTCLKTDARKLRYIVQLFYNYVLVPQARGVTYTYKSHVNIAIIKFISELFLIIFYSCIIKWK